MINYPAVTYAPAEHQGHLFWITYKWLKLLRKASHLQVIQNSGPSVVRLRQCDIQILLSNLETGNIFSVDFSSASCGSINLVHGNRLKVTGCRLASTDARNKFYKLIGSSVWYWLSSIDFVVMLIKYHCIGYL